MGRFFPSLRARALLALATLFVLVIGGAGYRVALDRGDDIDRAKALLQQRADSIAEAEHDVLDHVGELVAVLVTTNEFVEFSRGSRCPALLGRFLKNDRRLANIAIASPSGELICNATPTSAPVNVADRSYFQKALQSRDIVIEQAIQGRSSGKWSLPFAQSIRNGNGTPRGVIIVTLDLGWLNAELAKTDLGEGARIGLIDARGIVLARYPDAEGAVGHDRSSTPFFRVLRAHGGSGVAESIGFDGVPRIYAFARFAETTGGPIYLWVGVTKESVVVNANRHFIMTMLFAVALAGLACAAIWFGGERYFLRPVSAIALATRRLADGEYDARTGVAHGEDELGQLAAGLDGMAAALVSKNELLRVNRALRVLSESNRNLVRARSEQQLMDDTCRILVDSGGYRMAWVGFVEADAAKTVRPVAQRGVGEGYLESAHITWADTERGRGPTGTAIRTASTQVIENVLTDPRLAPWREAALERGYQSSAALPLKEGSNVFGSLTIYAPEPDAFSGDEMKLLEELAEDLSFGITTLRLRSAHERERTEREQYLLNLVQKSPLAMLVTSGREQKVNLINAKFTALFGYTIEDLPDVAHWWPLAYPDEAYRERLKATWTERAARAIELQGEIEPMEATVRCKDGSSRYIEFRMSSIGEKNVVTFVDLTERRLAEEERERYLRFFRLSNDPMVIADPFGCFLRVNPALLRLTGYSEEELVAKPFLDFVVPEDRERTAAEMKLQVSTRPSLNFENRYRCKDGRVALLAWTAFFDKQDGVTYATARDITDLKRATDAVRESEERLRLQVERMPMALIVWGPDFRVKTWNPAAERIFGFSAAEAIGKHPYDFIVPKEAQPQVEAVWRRLLEGDSTAHSVNENSTKDGRTIVCEWNNTPLRRPDGAVVGSISMVQDITERKQAERALRKVHRALKVLSNGNAALVHATDESGLLNEMCRVIAEAEGYRQACVVYAERDPAKPMRLVAQAGRGAGAPAKVDESSEDDAPEVGPVRSAISSGEIQVVQNVLTDPRFERWRAHAAQLGYGSVLVAPLISGSAAIGALCIHAEGADAFDGEEIALLRELAGDMAYGIVTLRMRLAHERDTLRIERSMEATIAAMAATVEMRDPYTAGHQRRVAALAVGVARELKLAEERVHAVHLAGVVHDLGKIQIPAEILSKPTRLTAAEMELIKAHPEAGYEILKGIDFPWPIAQMVLQHHERLDGSGYPRKLKGDEILLEARILAVTDVVEAMASHRPYRPALGLDAALKEITSNAGKIYDAQVVAACQRLLSEPAFAFPAAA